ncbi:hypothetical protein BBJ28_00003911 [Nothophytophthora sp. Chile5]|nr:hypothetical protein BBJ28_00003911 [Nothophytophthora sp. Chile5]
MLAQEGKQRADAATRVPAEPPVTKSGGVSAEDAKPSAPADNISGSALEPEKSRAIGDTTDAKKTVAETAVLNGTHKAMKNDADPNDGAVDKPAICCECRLVKGANDLDVVRVCPGCKLAVHTSCYGELQPAAALLETQKDVDEALPAEKTPSNTIWECDCCQRGVSRLNTKCEYCEKVGGEAAMRVVDTSGVAFWNKSAMAEGGAASPLPIWSASVHFGHVLCVKWDPRRLVPQEYVANSSNDVADPGSSSSDAENPKKATTDDAEDVLNRQSDGLVCELPPTECCFCRSTGGVRIQCRRVNCAQFFHVMCAHQGAGHVELRSVGISQYHAYCDRHRDCTEDMADFLAKLLSRPIRLLIGRDDARRFLTLAKKQETYEGIGLLLRDLAALLVSFCNKGLRASKSDPPEYSLKHLQVLQFFLDNVPQLEKVYALPTTSSRDLVDDKKLFRRLEKAFNPPRYLDKYPGPFNQQYVCVVCLEPFHERQHLFYCANEGATTVPHVQHWRCTKRRSTARERDRHSGNGGSSKKKKNAISVVQGGVRKDMSLPKGLPSATDEIICGVCDSPVDARGLIASRKEAKRSDFEKKGSSFVQNGCFINATKGKASNGGARLAATAAATSTTATSSRRPARTSDSRNSRRSHSITTDNVKSNGSLVGQHALIRGEPALAPLKMERINVQRTTRWIACVGQIIRLAGAPAPKPPVAGRAPESTAAATSSEIDCQTRSPSGASQSATAASSAATAVSTAEPPMAASDSDAMTVETTQRGELVNGQCKAEPDEKTVTLTASARDASTTKEDEGSLVSDAMQAYFEEAMHIVRPYDPYALDKMQTAREMLRHRNGPGVAVLRMLSQEYTRFVYMKHTRAVEKARAEKRKREEHEAQQHRERERKRINREAEQALKTQMLAMRNKQRQHLKPTTS